MRLGIIGCGGIAPLHIESYKNNKEIEIVSLCDLDLERAKKLASKNSIKNVYTDYWKMFEKEKLDFVSILTPQSTHKKIACDAAEVVQSIFLEKPMAMSVEECDAILEKVNKYDRNLCIGHSQIFHPNIQKVKKIIDGDDFTLTNFNTTLRGDFEILRKHELVAPWNISPNQGGILWEVCTHHVYLHDFFLPKIEEVYALGSNYKYPVYDDFSVLLKTSEAPYGVIEISWLSKEMEVLYEIKGLNGDRLYLHWQYDYLERKNMAPPFSYTGVLNNFLTDEKRLLAKWYGFTNQYLSKRKRLPFYNLISSYFESIKNDTPSPVTGEDGRRTVAILEGIKESLDTKKAVTIKK